MTDNNTLTINDHDYKTLLDRAVVGFYRTTINGKYDIVNTALARMYGYRTSEDLIKHYNDISTQLYVRSDRRADFAKAIAESGEVFDFDAEVYKRDGSRIWIREHARAVSGPGGEILYYEGTVTDITEQRKAEEEVRILQASLNSISEGLVITDEYLFIRWCNPAFCEMTGYDTSELVGENISLPILSDETDELLHRLWSAARSETAWRGEQFIRRKNGDRFPSSLSMTLAQMESTDRRHFVIVCTDITDRKNTEERLNYHACHDALTGLPNRMFLRTRLKEEIERAQKNGTSLASKYPPAKPGALWYWPLKAAGRVAGAARRIRAA